MPPPNPWLSVPLEDYEGHMSLPEVRQLPALSRLFGRALELCRPASVAIVGVAGGNGLERIDCASTSRIVGLDIHPSYLDAVRRRFAGLPGLELHCVDIALGAPAIAPVDLVHAALVFEHTGLETALDAALALVAPGGRVSVVLQLPSEEQAGVAPTGFASIQGLRDHFRLIDVGEFRTLLLRKGFRVVAEERRAVPSGKALWMGVFERAG